jgi:ubiquinone/menaquinone biosynthesis C-methylase UbiE
MTTTIQTDFDRLALLDTDGWSHNSHYHAYLLKSLPAPCQEGLEIGCGTGSFARLLARHSQHVLALDLSPQMIRIAKERSRHCSNIEFQVADIQSWPFPVQRFDCIVSIATLHHVSLESILPKLKSALRPRGVLLILDLFQSEGIPDLLAGVVALPTHVVLRLVHTGRLREPREVREAWATHGRNDTYLRVSAIRRICDMLLPQAIIKKHLLWRYSLVWRKPEDL